MEFSGLDLNLFTILSWLVVGLVVGSLARFLVPGADPMGCLATALLGILGSFVGGGLSTWIFEGSLDVRPSGIIGSLVGAIVLVLLLRLLRGGSRG